MKQRIGFLFILFALSLAIAYPIHAGNLKIKAPKKVTIKDGKNKASKKIKIYFKRRNITDECKVRVKGKYKKAVKIESGRIKIKSGKIKKRKITIKIIVKVNPSKIEPFKDSDEIDDFYDYDYDHYNDEDSNGGETYNIIDDTVDSYFYGYVKKKAFFKSYKITKKIKIKIKSNKKPPMSSMLLEYFTRDNYFSVWIKNKSSFKSITVLGYGAKAIDKDYKSFDRTLRTGRKRNITIKPGKGKYIDLYVNGSTTWYDEKDFTIRIKVKYRGKVFNKYIYY